MRTVLVTLCLCSLLPSVALAQDAAAPLEDRPGVKLNEVEHGIFVGVEAGGLFLFGPKASPTAKTGFSPGGGFAFTIGGDIGDIVSLGLLVMGSTVSTPNGFASDGPTAMKGSFTALTLGAIAKVSPFGFKDSNDVKRAYVYARVGGGYSIIGPNNFYKDGDIAILGGLGIEYFTHLRHFSLGLTVDFFYGIQHMGPGLMLTPNLRYTF
ncbi:MAG TPA: adventurous gliding motility protein CglE [Myxococcales bacterium]|jgi:hypothetical protein